MAWPRVNKETGRGTGQMGGDSQASGDPAVSKLPHTGGQVEHPHSLQGARGAKQSQHINSRTAGPHHGSKPSTTGGGHPHTTEAG